MITNEIFNIPVNDIKKDKLLRMCLHRIKKKKKLFIITLNSLMVINYLFNRRFYQAVRSAHLIIPDGYGIVLAGKFFNRPIQNQIPGIDLAWKLLGMAHENNLSIFLLGSTWKIISMAHKVLVKWFPKAKFLGRFHGYFGPGEEKKVISGINKVKPDILLVGMGTPAQEIWISENLSGLKAGVIIGIGGSFDVISGAKKRAPVQWRKNHLEWLYRSISSPMKIINLFKILLYCLIMFYFKLFRK